MRIDIQLLPYPPDPGLLSNRSVVVIDVLRATSVVVHALSRGALEIIPVETVEDAFRKTKAFSPGTVLTGGERQSRKIEGFDLGNSPREYLPEVVRGKRIILTTTNGTRAFHFVSDGKEVMAASFLNIDSTANRCMELRNDLLIFLSGDEGRFSLEDAVCGGMLIDRICRKGKVFTLTDASLAAHVLFQRFEPNLLEALQSSCHGKDLVRLGLEDDLAYCAQTDLFPLVPVFRNGVIRVNENAEFGLRNAD
jgi:2-phosphosulfolactate phosphatase